MYVLVVILKQKKKQVKLILIMFYLTPYTQSIISVCTQHKIIKYFRFFIVFKIGVTLLT